jgi:transposase
LAEQEQLTKAREKEIELLIDQLRKLKRQFFSSKSERVMQEWDESQLLFNDLEAESSEPESSPEAKETITYSGKKKGRKSKPLPEDLPREIVNIDIDESEKVCSTHSCELKPMGSDVTEKLKVVPAKMWVVEEHRLKYCCPKCEGGIKQKPAQGVLPGTIATPELLSYIIFSKFFQGLPLYRNEELFKVLGVDLTRGRMASWLISLSTKLTPIHNVLAEMAEESGYQQIDQTRVQVLKEPGRKATAKSAMWVRGSPEKNIALFHYHPSQSGYVAKDLMGDFKGVLQSDAHAAFDQVDVGLQLGCMMHARRKFYEALKGSQKQRGLASYAIQMIKKIYEFEDLYKKQKLTAQSRKQARDKDVLPLYGQLKTWCESQKPKVPPSTDLGQAISYYLTQYERLSSCLEDGRYEIDNGWCERAIRKFAIGRNNWLFSDSVEGAEASSIYYSLMVTAKLNKKNPYDVLVDVLTEVPKAETIDDFEALAKKFMH